MEQNGVKYWWRNKRLYVTYMYHKQVLAAWLVGWLVGDHLLLRNFFTLYDNIYEHDVISIPMVWWLNDFGSYRIFMMFIIITSI
jgi:hypothetical protein